MPTTRELLNQKAKRRESERQQRELAEATRQILEDGNKLAAEFLATIADLADKAVFECRVPMSFSSNDYGYPCPHNNCSDEDCFSKRFEPTKLDKLQGVAKVVYDVLTNEENRFTVTGVDTSDKYSNSFTFLISWK